MTEALIEKEVINRFTHTPGPLQIGWQRATAHRAQDITKTMWVEVTHETRNVPKSQMAKEEERVADQAEMDMLRIASCWNACEDARLACDFLDEGGLKQLRLLAELVRDRDGMGSAIGQLACTIMRHIEDGPDE